MNNSIASFFEENRELHTSWLHTLHSLAEKAFEEVETSNFVFSVLKEHCQSLKVTKGLNDLPTAVLAVFTPQDATQSTVLLRADMDGLPIRGTDGTAQPLHPDVHHACGHDGHMACLLSCAHWLHNFQDLPRRKLVLFFQPAEERGAKARGGSGARVAIDRGGLLNTLHRDVTAVYALHCWPDLEVGEFALGPGAMMGMSGLFEIQMIGRGGHAAKPSEEGGDALLAASTLVVSAQAVIARGIDPFQPVTAAFTRVENVDGAATNAIASHVRVLGTLRTLDIATRDSVRKQITRHAEAAAAMHGCTAIVEFRDGYPATKNSEGGVRVARGAALRAVHGDESSVYQIGLANGLERPSLCAEDFSLLLERRGGAYVWLGNGKKGPSLHQSNFCFNEQSLAFGGKFFVHVAVSRESGGDKAKGGEF